MPIIAVPGLHPRGVVRLPVLVLPNRCKCRRSPKTAALPVLQYYISWPRSWWNFDTRAGAIARPMSGAEDASKTDVSKGEVKALQNTRSSSRFAPVLKRRRT